MHRPANGITVDRHTGELDSAESLDSRKFLIAIKRLADSLNYGTDSSPFLGSGLEFVQSRLYQPGDPIKSIDWRVTARTGKIFVKEYEAPKRMPVYLVVDTSASMIISSQPRSKYALAVQIAGGVALACLDRISPVGVISAGGRPLLVRPTLSKDRVLQWLFQLRRFRDDEPTQLAKRLFEVGPTLTSRVLFVVISDMHDSGAVEAIKRLNQQHDCCVVQLRDPLEDRFVGTGFYRAREAESGRALIAHGRSRLLDQAQLEADLKKSGIDHLVVPTDEPVAVKLRQFFGTRGLIGRGAR